MSNKEIDFEEESGMTSKTWVKYAMCSDCSDETAGGCENGGEIMPRTVSEVATCKAVILK